MGLSNAERQRRYIQRLKAKAARASHATIDDSEVTALRHELAKAQRHIAELAVALANKERLEAETKAEKPAPTPDEARDREIKSLKTRNRNLRIELQSMKQYYDTELAKRGRMSFTDASAIAKGLQPASSEDERLAGLQAFNLFRSNERKARKP